MKVGDLVRLKPEAAEGDAKGLGVGVIVEEGADQWNQEFVRIQWLKTMGKPWFRYKEDVELIRKTSGAPEKGDLVTYEWKMEYRQYQTTALVIGEHGIAVKVLMLGLRTRDWRHEGDYRVCDYNIHKMTIPRTECKILSTRQGEIRV